MKKILSVASTLILLNSAGTILLTNINNYQTVSKINTKSSLNWLDIENYNKNYFQTIKESYYKNSNSKLLRFKDTKEVNFNKLIAFAKQKTDSYIIKFKNKNFNLEQIINNLSKDNNKFAEIYNNVLNQNNSVLTNNVSFSTNLALLKNNSFSSLESKVNNLKISKTTFVTISATAASALAGGIAAGFWVAAWFFGISVPWATGCTTTSALAGGIAAGINMALVNYDNQLSEIDKATISAFSIYKLGHIFYAILNPLLIGVGATVTALSWAFPAILSIIPVVSSILAWINLFS